MKFANPVRGVPERWRGSSVAKIAAAVFCIAMMNGAAWSLLTPPFQVPDETAHFAYVQRLAESGVRAGDINRPEFSMEQRDVMATIGTLTIIGRPLSRVVRDKSTAASSDAALENARKEARRDDGGGPSTASSQPPLFYMLSAIPYRAFSWASLPVRLHAMRALSAAIFALGASLCALFVHELMPQRPGAALCGGLAVALSPYTAFIASGVTPDTLLLAVCAGLLVVLARALRRGLSAPRGGAIGLLVGAGLTTKLTFLAFLVPACIAVFALIARDRRQFTNRGGLLRPLVRFAVSTCVLPGLFIAWVAFTGRAVRPASDSTAVLAREQIKMSNPRELLSYAWQLFLPRLPFMDDQFGFSPLREIWLHGYAGRYGWLDYGAPKSINSAVVAVADAVAVLLATAAIVRRKVLRAHWLEGTLGLLFLIALGAVIAKAGYDYRRTTGFAFEQPRYLFPIAAFYALAIAMSCESLGRRLSPFLATATVGLLLLHNLSGLALTVVRYYS